MAKKLYIKTYGCQMNVYDSGRIADLMKPLGFALSETPEDADMVVLNTCHIREKAAEKVYSDLGRVRLEKERRAREGKRTVIAVAGCVAQAEGMEIKARAPFVDVVVGPQSYQNLPRLVMGLQNAQAGGNVVSLDFAAHEKFDRLPEESSPQVPSAFLTVQEGCDKFCTFCVVPYTRGAEYSRGAAEIRREAERLVANGAIEITLLGQNVNAWKGRGVEGGNWTLGALIRHLAEIPGLERIRYTTSHPRDMDGGLIAAHGEVTKLMPFLHLPVQSGSDRILREMNRKHTAEEYFRIVERLRAARPDIQLSSDFIVGFPGETEADFEDTLALMRAVGFAQAYSFKYSPRPGTQAANRDGQVPEEIKEERLARLQELLRGQQLAFNERCVGLTMPVLFDRNGKHPGQAIGRSPYMQSVHVRNGASLMGQVADVRITGASASSLAGDIGGEQRAAS